MTSVEHIVAPEQCGCCSRKYFPDWTACRYCGWDPAAPEQTHSRFIPDEEFRCVLSLQTFGVQAALLAAVAAFWVSEALGSQRFESTWLLWAGAVAAVIAGPGLFALQVWRRQGGSVHLCEEGLERDGLLWTWSDIARAEYRGGLLRGESRESMNQSLVEALDGTALYLLRRLAIIVSLLGSVYFAAMSFLALLTPWHPRVELHLVSGGMIVLHYVENGPRLERTVMGYLVGPHAVANG